MAKTKAGRRVARGGSTNAKKNIENGLYIHSSPPKAYNSDNGAGSASIRQHIRTGDIDALEEVVLSGHGARLVNQHATDTKVRNFLKTVPSYMSKIDLLHDSVEKGNLRDLKALLDRRKLARARDSQGVGLLHKAVLHGHKNIVEYLVEDYPETLQVKDNDGRTPLHYCAVSKFSDDMYNLLCEATEDTQVEDNKGRTAADYMANPSAMAGVSRLAGKRGSGASKGKRRTPRKRNSPTVTKGRTPPKRGGLNITHANIRIWIHDQDLAKLEQIVWEGQGDRLLKETSNHPKVRQFLNLVPRMMSRIKEVHNAALKADLETLEAKADPPDILVAKDQNGLNPLHKAAALGHREVVEWIVPRNAAAVQGQDNSQRTPLYYAAVAKDGGHVYEYLLSHGADPHHNDQQRKTADHYRWRPADLDLSVIYESPTAPRDGNNLDVVSNNSSGRSLAPSRNRSRNPSRRNSLGDDRKMGRGRDAKSRKNSSSGSGGSGSGGSGAPFEYRDLRDVTEGDIEGYIRDVDLGALECVVLGGRGVALQGKSSWTQDVRAFLKKVPGYMEKITALHEASSAGDLTRIKRLTKENPRLAMARSPDGAVALHYAARAGHVPATKHLLGLYPDALHVQDDEGRSVLHYAGMAAAAGSSGAYDLLKKEGAAEDTQDLEGLTPKDYLTKKPNGKTPSKAPSRAPSKAPSRAPSRAPSNAPSRAPSRAASKAPSRRGSPERGRKGSQQEERDVERVITAAEEGDFGPMSDMIVMGDGALLVGRKSQDEEVQEFLEKLPEQLASIDELHRATEAGETRRVVGLLDRKKKAHTRDAHHANILHKAAIHGHTDLVRYLVQTFPELMTQGDKAGRTPVHYAAVLRDGGHVYKIMAKAGGDTATRDNSGHSAAEYLEDPRILTQWDVLDQLAGGDGGTTRPRTKGSEATYYGDEEEGMARVDPDTLKMLEDKYKELKGTNSRMLMKKYLTKDVFDKLKHRVTSGGATLYDVIKSGLANPDSSIGMYAPDAESYTLFKELFDPVINEYHGGFGPNEFHPGINFGSPSALGDLNEWGDYVVSTRVRCARSLEGYPFNPLLTLEQYAEMEQDIEVALDSLDGDLAGYYRPLNRLSPKEQEELLEKHLLFKQGDRFLEAAGACRFWPDGRGIFLNSDDTLVVWVSEEDHMRIISMQDGGDLAQVYDRFVRSVSALGSRLPFSFSQRFGFLNFCPTNLGTAIRASVHIRLPNLGQDPRILEDTADQFHLQVRGTSGEHSEAKDFVFDISNRRRLGLTEIEAIQEMYDGVKEIIRLEKTMDQSRSRKGSTS